MKHLSSVEKEIVNQLFKTKNITIVKLLGNYTNDIKIKIDKTSNKVYLMGFNKQIQSSNCSDYIDFFLPKIIFISTLVQLLEILEKEYYIISHSFTRKEKNYYIDNEFNKTISDDECVSYEIGNSKIKRLLIHYSDCIVLKNNTLDEYVLNKYKTKDEIRFEKTYKISILALILSFIVGVGSLIIPVITKTTDATNINNADTLKTMTKNRYTE